MWPAVTCAHLRRKVFGPSSQVDAMLQVVYDSWRSTAVCYGTPLSRNLAQAEFSLLLSVFSRMHCSKLLIIQCSAPSDQRACWCALQGQLVSHTVSVCYTDATGLSVSKNTCSTVIRGIFPGAACTASKSILHACYQCQDLTGHAGVHVPHGGLCLQQTMPVTPQSPMSLHCLRLGLGGGATE